jgi:hypothetical protein
VSTNRILGIAAAALAVLAPFAGDTLGPGGEAEIDVLDVAEALRSAPGSIRIVDLRPEGDFAMFHLPRSERVDAAGLDGLDRDDRLLVLVGGPSTDLRRAWLALRKAGHARVRYLPEGAGAWVDRIVSPVLYSDATPAERAVWERQAELSRYFGGFPRVVETPRAGEDTTEDRVRQARRRGCAF